jgi:hypothetical protein
MYNGYRVSPGVKRPARGADHLSLIAPSQKWVELYLYYPCRPLVACYRVTFTFSLLFLIKLLKDISRLHISPILLFSSILHRVPAVIQLYYDIFCPTWKPEILILSTPTSYHFLSASVSYWYTASSKWSQLSININDKQKLSHKIMTRYTEHDSKFGKLDTPLHTSVYSPLQYHP